MLGVLQFPEDFQVLESAGYVVCLSVFGLRVYSPPIDTGPPAGTDSWGINASLQSPSWPAFAARPDLMMVRFIAAFPQQNVWTVYGASRHLPVYSANGDANHAWFDVDKEGQLKEIAAPSEEMVGFSCAQLLTQLCIWPDAQGTLHCLPQHFSRWRPIYLRLSELTARVGEGAVSEKEYYQRVREDPELSQVAPLQLDAPFVKYLARLKAAGGLHLSTPNTAEQLRARKALAKRVLRETGVA